MEGVLPTSLECLDLETGIQWSSLTGSSAIRCLLKECAHQCFHGNKLLAEQQAEELLDVTWEKLNTGHWKDVKIAWRHIFSYASLLKVLCIYSRNPLTPQILQEALTACDRGLLMGAPIMNGILTQLASCLHRGGGVSMDTDTKSRGMEYGDDGDDTALQEQKRKRMKLDDHPAPVINEDHQIRRLVTPSLQAFLVDNMEKESPVIIKEAMDHWPARSHRRWSLSYLRKIAGKRTVPVELGSKYTDDTWSQSLMTLADFIDHHIDIQKDRGSSTKVGYLAQHQLFDQIPELKADICIPDYCCLHLPDSSNNTPGKMENLFENDDGRKTTRGGDDEKKCHREDNEEDNEEDAKQLEEKQDGGSGKDGVIDGTKKPRHENKVDTYDDGGMEQGDERKNEQGNKMTDHQGKNQFGNGGVIDETKKQRGDISKDKSEDRGIEQRQERRNEQGNDGGKEQGVEMMVATQGRDDDEEEKEEEDIDINAWFGPAGTVSPLHFDPKHNLLGQVVGKKYIRLYSKDSTPLLYKHEGLLSNTSQVDVENVDVDTFPLFQQAPYQECILSEGEMLYIPPGCWHYIRSLSLSFSVSFWWR